MAVGQRSIGIATGPRVAPAGVGPEPFGPTGELGIPGNRYVRVERLSQALTGQEVATGVVQAVLPAPGQGYAMLIERVFIRTTGGAATSFTIYEGERDDISARSYTDEGDLNEIDGFGVDGLWISQGQPARFVWEGTVPAGAVCYVAVQWVLVAIVSGVVS